MSSTNSWVERQLAFVSQSALSTAVGALGPATLLYFYMVQDFPKLKIWYGVAWLFNIIRFGFTSYLAKSLSSDLQKPHTYYRIYASISIVSSSVWIYIGIFILPQASPESAAFLAIIYAGISTGLLVVNLVCLKLVVASLLVLLLPFAWGIGASEISFGFGAMLLTLFYMTILIKMSFVIHNLFYEQFLLAIENTVLAVDNQKKETSLIQAAHLSTIGQMAGGIAHEISNPVSILSGLSDQLKRLVSSKHLEYGALGEIQEKLANTVERMAKIVRGMRKAARHGVFEEKAVCKLGDVVEETVAICEEKFVSQQVKLDWRKIAKEARVKVQAVQISQVLLNLLNNALDAVESSDEKWVRLETRNKNGFIELSITDSGHGIPEGLRQQIMDPFFTTKDVGKGTGLGLSISQTIMKSNDGYLFLDPEEAHTKFIMGLPIREESSSPI